LVGDGEELRLEDTSSSDEDGKMTTSFFTTASSSAGGCEATGAEDTSGNAGMGPTKENAGGTMLWNPGTGCCWFTLSTLNAICCWGCCCCCCCLGKGGIGSESMEMGRRSGRMLYACGSTSFGPVSALPPAQG